MPPNFVDKLEQIYDLLSNDVLLDKNGVKQLLKDYFKIYGQNKSTFLLVNLAFQRGYETGVKECLKILTK